jgi:hypothetical protein
MANFALFRKLEQDATDELKVWGADAIKSTLAMLPQDESQSSTAEERFDRFSMRMSLIMYSLNKHSELIGSRVYEFLSEMTVKG